MCVTFLRMQSRSTEAADSEMEPVSRMKDSTHGQQLRPCPSPASIAVCTLCGAQHFENIEIFLRRASAFASQIGQIAYLWSETSPTWRQSSLARNSRLSHGQSGPPSLFDAAVSKKNVWDIDRSRNRAFLRLGAAPRLLWARSKTRAAELFLKSASLASAGLSGPSAALHVLVSHRGTSFHNEWPLYVPSKPLASVEAGWKCRGSCSETKQGKFNACLLHLVQQFSASGNRLNLEPVRSMPARTRQLPSDQTSCYMAIQEGRQLSVPRCPDVWRDGQLKKVRRFTRFEHVGYGA